MLFPISRPLKLCVFGAGPGTGNLGVDALRLSLLAGIARRVETPQITVFDFSSGARTGHARVAGRDLTYSLCGAVNTRRIYRRESLWQIRTAGRLGGLRNEAIRAIREADAVLDVTGGDSFTDLYGRRRFRLATLQKIIALEQRCPVILLPQTIGPFEGVTRRSVARRILRSVDAVWARGQASFRTLQQLLGEDFDSNRHHCGVDLAFGLESREPDTPLPAPANAWLDGDTAEPLIGLNVSGLIYNHAAGARRRYGLRADYRRAMIRFMERVLHETEANILLVPHVFSAPGHKEHDPDACAAVATAIKRLHDHRVTVVPEGYDACETKWIISKTDWFCGSRLHSTIAALSSGVPTATAAYSVKARGVFETCEQDRHVADLRELDTDDVVDRLWRSFSSRQETRRHLNDELPSVLARVDSQMDEIVSRCETPQAVLRSP